MACDAAGLAELFLVPAASPAVVAHYEAEVEPRTPTPGSAACVLLPLSSTALARPPRIGPIPCNDATAQYEVAFFLLLG